MVLVTRKVIMELRFFLFSLIEILHCFPFQAMTSLIYEQRLQIVHQMHHGKTIESSKN